MNYFLLVLLIISCSHGPGMSHSHSVSPAKYHRKQWSHWSDSDKDCQNTRQEILIKRSLIPVLLNRKGCTVVKGKWDDYYYPQIHTKSAEVDIDHVIPLKHAHDMGGAAWTRDKKEVFANDPENLVITDKTYNRQKGAKRIDQWLPIKRDYACKYIKDWTKLKKKYQLRFTQHELKAIELAACLD